MHLDAYGISSATYSSMVGNNLYRGENVVGCIFSSTNAELELDHLSMSLNWEGGHLSIMPALIMIRILYSSCWMQEQTQMQGTTPSQIWVAGLPLYLSFHCYSSLSQKHNCIHKWRALLFRILSHKWRALLFRILRSQKRHTMHFFTIWWEYWDLQLLLILPPFEHESSTWKQLSLASISGHLTGFQLCLPSTREHTFSCEFQTHECSSRDGF